MASTARTDELKKKFDENPRRYFAPLANEFRKMGELDQAIMICEEFLPQQPGHMSGHIVYGQALYESGKLPASRVVFETALGLDPENLIALRHLGDISRSEGDQAGARRWYDRVLEADPRNEEIQGLLAALDSAPPAGTEFPSAGSEMSYAPAVPAMPGGRTQSPPPELAPIDLDLSEAGLGGPPASAPVESEHAPSLDERPEGLSLHDTSPPTADVPTPSPLWGSAAPAPDVSMRRTEGFEAGEFEAPEEPTARADGLEPAEFEAPTISGPRAEGLEENPFDSPPLQLRARSTASITVDHESLPEPDVAADESTVAATADVETDDGSTLAPHGDALIDGAVTTEYSALDAADAPDPSRAKGYHNEEYESDLEPDADLDDVADEAAATSGLPMMETSASVIAAEAELIETGSSLESTNAMADDEDVYEEQLSPTAPAPFVTETMAELYLTQGFRDRALAVYQQLSDSAPDDTRLRAKIADLKPRPSLELGPTVREFFARIAGRRPNERIAVAAAAEPPADDDFALPEAEPAPERAPALDAARFPTPSSSSAAAPMSSGTERGATAQGGSAPAGSIDALFGNRSVGRSEDSAASALAQAFSGSIPVVPTISGKPARAASGELSLDSVFRDGPPRPPRSSQSFSFDQFFSENAAATTTPAQQATKAVPAESAEQGVPAERGADDIQQFNSWLQGLKQK